MSDRPKVSVIIVAYNMAREIPRTVFSFLPPYQRGLALEDVEILVLENGSDSPVDPACVASWPSCVRYLTPDEIRPSPAYALNFGARMARGDYVCPVIDGARMASPGLLAHALEAAHGRAKPFIATVGLHIGEKPQQFAAAEGYDQGVEDAMLAQADWSTDGYRLFEIACFGRSAETGWFGKMSESNAPVLRREHFLEFGGFDTGFNTPGGGLVNLDFFRRCVEDKEVFYALLLGEGTFHQYHGGVSTSEPVKTAKAELGGKSFWDLYVEEYQQVRGKTWRPPTRTPYLFGQPVAAGLPPLRSIRRALGKAIRDTEAKESRLQ